MLLVGNGSSPHVWAVMVYPESEIRHQLACFLALIYGLDGGQTMFFLKLMGKFRNPVIYLSVTRKYAHRSLII